MELKEHRRWRLMVSILSISLLTVMAGAAVAPALGIIREYFSDEPLTVVQLIISMPALFIAITNLFFGRLCRIFTAKKLTLIGLIMYVVFGCAAGLFSNIYLVLVCRALLGIGVGILMPLSTGLISYYFTKDKQDMQDMLMGYSSAMNMMGGVIATLIAGLLAIVSWRLSFLVYLMGVLCIVLVMLFQQVHQRQENQLLQQLSRHYQLPCICLSLQHQQSFHASGKYLRLCTLLEHHFMQH